MFSARSWFRSFVIVLPFLLWSSALGVDFDEEEPPDITGRVARISFISDEVQIRRSGSQDWEKAALNLPLVEGDEIVTSMFARVEIQFDSRTFVRVEEKSAVRITTLKDEGIALSVPTGTISIRITEFDKDKAFFEVDIPSSTVAIERSGLYRIDAGAKDSAEVRVRANEGGEARVYSDTSGFTLRNGRSATISITGPNAGEWATYDASTYSDGFDAFIKDRDDVVANRVRVAYYDRYYDRDIFGAEDLNDYGEWVHTRKYGYVWRPFASSVAGYADWSPYRYGHWRWLPPYGWTWVNDEPWGWATYHYGRWIWDDNRWYWTPYGYYRYRRSWWQPALVAITIYGNNVCWYPLAYHHHYHNYYRHRDWRDGRNNGGGRNPVPTATPTPTTGPTAAQINEERRARMHSPTFSTIPPSGVVTVSSEEFGKGRTGIRRPTLEVAKTVISKDPDDRQTPPILLPPYETVSSKIGKEIRVDSPPIIVTEGTVRTGVADRKAGEALDEQLKQTRILNNRTPVVRTPTSVPTTQTDPVPTTETRETRRTGAVERPSSKQQETQTVETPPIVVVPRSEPKEERRSEPTMRRQETKTESPRRSESPKYEPPPSRSESPKSEPRSEPKSSPPPQRSDPPPQKSEPTKVDKPSDSDSGSKKKDGR